MVRIPYKGGAPMLSDLMGGQIPVGNLPSSLPHIRSGKIRALAVTTSRRWPGAPEIPTVAESGVVGYEASAWFGLLAPAGTPKPVVDLLQRTVGEIVRRRCWRWALNPWPIRPRPLHGRSRARSKIHWRTGSSGTPRTLSLRAVHGRRTAALRSTLGACWATPSRSASPTRRSHSVRSGGTVFRVCGAARYRHEPRPRARRCNQGPAERSASRR
jgi:hypothetical protein